MNMCAGGGGDEMRRLFSAPIEHCLIYSCRRNCQKTNYLRVIFSRGGSILSAAFRLSPPAFNRELRSSRRERLSLAD